MEEIIGTKRFRTERRRRERERDDLTQEAASSGVKRE